MSVEVKTPTKTQFEHVEFQCGERTPPGSKQPSKDSGFATADCTHKDNGKNSFQEPENQNQKPGVIGRKRRSSERLPERSGSFSGMHPLKKKSKHGKTPEKIVLPSKFLLGGNINDPLNLNSLCDEAVSEALNKMTPQSSPLPTLPPYRRQVQVMIPPNISDPLNLNSGEDLGPSLKSPKAKKKRQKKKRRSTGDNDTNNLSEPSDVTRPLHIDVQPFPDTSPTITPNIEQKLRNIVDKIVSPVIPQPSPKGQKRKRTSSESESTKSDSSTFSKSGSVKTEKTPNLKGKLSRQSSNQKTVDPEMSGSKGRKPRHKEKKFIYGNYNQYYGYRNPSSECDHRIKSFRGDWFEGKDILDIGCNVGHLTLDIAKRYGPRKIVGIDIDGSLIAAARKNVRHYISSSDKSQMFPVSMPLCYGPVVAPGKKGDNQKPEFPNNVTFVQGNYVLENDVLLDMQPEEYDAVLLLSISKWIHLNWGDAGLKRTFRRVYKQLRPGGRLILEPQGWTSYKKKKNLTEEILKNFHTIRFKPDQFTEYLLSKEVGFSTCELIDVPFNRSKGFQRPIQVFTKGTNSLPGTAQNTPVLLYDTPERGCPTPEQSHKHKYTLDPNA